MRRIILCAALGLSIVLFLLGYSYTYSTPTGPTRHRFLPAAASSTDADNTFNATLGFEKVLVVGLPSRTDRRDSMILSAALSNIEVDFIDGILGATVEDKVIPLPPGVERMQDPSVGSWRGHLNAIQDVIRRNLSSALILEDDIDWDVRLKSQLHDFALSSRALVQPLPAESDVYADPTYPTSPDVSFIPIPISFDDLPDTVPPQHSPYGDGWDILWLGHCGMRMPSPEITSPETETIPRGRVVHYPDHTVPQTQYLRTLSGVDDVKEQYANHTRVVHHVSHAICSLGYAVTQNGARKILREIGLRAMDGPYDILLRYFCEGSFGRDYHNCLTVSPSLFFHHRPAGSIKAGSDIADHGEGYRDIPYTDVIRWSTRMNWDVLLNGGTEFVDQFPDVE
ncbi:hypothetical protein B7494_g2160 [Chlorociboria aeruginascens]|nr:hypothetical protein B7494_g2160 [Chlorociboria aeruginascens]